LEPNQLNATIETSLPGYGGILPQVGKQNLFCPGEGTKTSTTTINKDAEANLRNTCDNEGSLLYLRSECKQKVASLCTGCNGLQHTGNSIRLALGQFCTDLAFPRSFDDSECLGYAFRIIEIESLGRAWLSRCEGRRHGRFPGGGNANPLYRMRTPSLSVLSCQAGNVHSAGCETSVAESLYLLQQPAYDCSLRSLSGNNSKASSHPPCPVSRNLECQWAIFVQQSEC